MIGLRRSFRRRFRFGLAAVAVFAQLIATTGAPLPIPPHDATSARKAAGSASAPTVSLCSGGSACCCATSGAITCGCCCSAVAKPSPTHAHQSEAEFRWVGGILTAKCRADGLAGLLKADVAALPPTSGSLPKPSRQPCFVLPADWYATPLAHRPPTPPPRWS
ncbi:MAG: hypothetical protein RMJ56_18405 [Gemmataceae bacterium]|nr:hypothetical protein [Gemmata sp.]MDW8199570.1 hypothetical protein [Gemmataceae bacterium]